MATISAAMKAHIQRQLGAGTSILTRDDIVDIVWEVAPVLLGGPSPPVQRQYFSAYGYDKVIDGLDDKKSPPRLLTAGPRGVNLSVLASSIGETLPDGSINFSPFRTGQLTQGGIELANPDGELDYLVTDYGWGDSSSLFKIGRHGDAYTSFETFLPFLVRIEPTYNFRTGTIRFEAKSGLVNYNAPIQSTTFAGSGGWEGGSDLVGQTKPVLLGVRRNVPLTLVDFANQRHVVSDGVDGINALVAGYEGGFPAGGAWTLEAANGGVSLPNAPQAGPVTAHIQGEKFDGGAYSNEQGKIIEELIARVNAGIALNATDRGNFTDAAGIHIPTNSALTLGQAMDRMRLPLGYGPYPEQDGSELRLGTIAAPAGPAQETYKYQFGEILDIDAEMFSPPATKVRVGYQGLDTVIEAPLAEDATTAEFLSSPWRFKEAEDTAIPSSYRNAVVLTVFSPLDDPTEAQTAATTLLAIFKVARWKYTIKLATKFFHSWIGDEVEVTYPRFGLDSGKFLLVTGVGLEVGGKSLRGADYTMECWG